jgi:hypothetical protein
MQKKPFQLFFLGFFVLTSCSNGNDYLPKKLGDLTLTKMIQNEKATRIINKMHGKKLDVTDNFIAYYGSKKSRNILYATVYQNAEKAQTDLVSMAKKIAKGTRIFSPLEPIKIGGNVHFQTEGMGLRHYFYSHDNILICWQVEPDKAESTYNDLISYDFAKLKKKTKRQ